MAVSSRSTEQYFIPKNNRDNALANAAGDDNAFAAAGRAEVSVIYYLSRNGRLEHPHFIQVPISSRSPQGGLYLKDLINRLNFLRGNGMANRYSWSSKRSYKNNGYVWQDLSEDDLIHPTSSHDYVLKGSEILYNTHIFETHRQASSLHDETHQCDNSSSSWRTTTSQFNRSLSSFEDSWNHYPKEQLNCRCESNRELGRKSADAATQTREDKISEKRLKEEYSNKTVELNKEELPSPPCNSSSEGLDRLSESGNNDRSDRTVKNRSVSWRIKAAQVLIPLIARGSLDSTKDFGVDGKKKQLCFGMMIRSGIIRILRNKRRI